MPPGQNAEKMESGGVLKGDNRNQNNTQKREGFLLIADCLGVREETKHNPAPFLEKLNSATKHISGIAFKYSYTDITTRKRVPLARDLKMVVLGDTIVIMIEPQREFNSSTTVAD